MKSNDIIMRPCARCASCKINISNLNNYCSINENYVMLLVFKYVSIFINATQI